MYALSERQLRKASEIGKWKRIGAGAFASVGIDLDELITFNRKLYGYVVFPWDPTYNEDRQEYNPAYQYHPIMIVYCQVPSDVRLALAWAQLLRPFGWQPVLRSGGHSYAGFSADNWMIIDTSLMAEVSVDPVRKHAVVGAGATAGKIDIILNGFRLHVPSPGGSSVGTAGFVQGGGYGFTSREYGMACDNALEMRVMLADGRIVVASQEKNADLFWAMRGGTGNNFGVLLDVKYQLHDLYMLWGFRLQWDLDQAPVILEMLQQGFMKDATPKLGYLAGLTSDTRNSRKIGKALVMMGMYHGTPDEGRAVLQPLLDTGPEIQIDQVGTYQHLNQLVLAVPYPVPDVLPNSKCEVMSGYVDKVLTPFEWGALVELYKQAPNQGDFICVEPYGGAINAVPVGSNAFIHRKSYMDLWWGTFWVNVDDRPKAIEWLLGLQEGTLLHVNGHSYQNYPNRRQTDFRWRYWGAYFDCLLQIKQKYDPSDFFHYAQSISPPPDALRPPVSAPCDAIPIDQPIRYEIYSHPDVGDEVWPVVRIEHDRPAEGG